MQSVSLDHTDRKILDLLQTEPGINASAIGERIGLSQSACWRRIQRLREEGVFEDHPVILNREKVGLTTMVFAHVKLTLRIVAEDIKAYEQFFFEKLSQLPGIQEVTSSIVLSDIKHSTALPV
jgi:Lrp/AsnC family transcriptional regulator